MADITTKFFEDLAAGATWSAGVAFKRSNPLPLDRYSVFQTKTLAEEYATSNAVAYPGQVIAVVENQAIKVYVLAESNGSLVLQEVGKETDLSNYVTTDAMAQAIADAIAAIPPVVLPDIVASGDGVVELSANGHTISATHGKKGPTGGATKGATADASISAFGTSIDFKVPSITVDEYGHTTALNEKIISINIPTLPEDKDTKYELKYESETVEGVTTKAINLYNSYGEKVSSIDASEFIKDGMLTDVDYDASSNTLTFVWNTDSGMKADTVVLSDILDPYTAGEKIIIDGSTISHATQTVTPGETGERTYVTNIAYDAYGHITGFTTGKETVVNTDTNDTYKSGNGIEITNENVTDTEHEVKIKLSDLEKNLAVDESGLHTTFNLDNYATAEGLDSLSESVDNLSEAIDNLGEDLLEESNRAKAAEEANATAAARAQEAAGTAQSAVNALTTVVSGKVDQTYDTIPLIDEASGRTLTADEFADGVFFYVDANGDYAQAVEYNEKTVYFVQAVDEHGALAYENVAQTLLTNEEKKKLAKLVFDEDGGVSVSGNINISQVQGLNGYLTEAHFSKPVVDKLNYINDVDSTYFAVSEGRKLEFNFIKSVDTATFAIEDVNTGVQDEHGANIILPKVLQLKSVPAAALKATVGDLALIKSYDDTAAGTHNVVDTLNQIHDILVWGFMD